MKKTFARPVALALVVLMLTALCCACAGDAGKPVLKVFNWGDYMDQDILAEFEEEYGCKVIYDEYETNEDMYLKLKNSGGSTYDVCFPSDYMIVKMIEEDMLAEIDFENVPGYANIDARFKDQPFDPQNKYSVPYMWGTVCIAYDPAIVTEPVTSWDILFDEKYAGQIFMMNSERDSIGVALMSLGYSINTKNMDELNEAKAKLIDQKPLLITYTVDDVKDKMIGGEGALALMWSCDIGFIRAENPAIQYAIPETGTNIWYDSVVVLKDAQNKELAEKFVDFLCRPEIAQKNCDYLDTVSPVTQVIEGLPAEIQNDPVLFPTEEIRAKSEVFQNLSELASTYAAIWSDVTA